jgi:hypothetical protein
MSLSRVLSLLGCYPINVNVFIPSILIYLIDMSTVCTGANRGVSRYLTENYPGLGIFTQVSNGC